MVETIEKLRKKEQSTGYSQLFLLNAANFEVTASFNFVLDNCIIQLFKKQC